MLNRLHRLSNELWPQVLDAGGDHDPSAAAALPECVVQDANAFGLNSR